MGCYGREVAQADDSGQARPGPSVRERLPHWLSLLLLGLVLLRVGYHANYLAEDPFALATFSDGRVYEQAALDLLEHPPLGSQPFYLQGLYAYQLALPMAILPWISLAMLLQLTLAGLALWGLFRAMAWVVGRREAGIGLAVLLAYPGLAFYENKYLTASIGVVTMVLMVIALARLQRRPTAKAVVWFGVTTGLAVLARGNMLLAVPGVAVAAALIWGGTGQARWRAMAWLALGLTLALGPMAIRNAIVIGRPSVMPAHGGGTSFYIGNNRHARGVWNSAGGLISGEVIHEREELVAELGVAPGSESEQAAAIGQALYRRAFDEMAEDPGGWLWLELRKAWLMVGNDELTQDYDVYGEREMLPWWAGRGLPFSIVLALGCVGAVATRRRVRTGQLDGEHWRPWWWMLGFQALAVVAANLLFFTSAQHRVPLVVPLVVFIGPGVEWLVRGRGLDDTAKGRKWWWGTVVLAVLLLAQGLLARQKHHEPSAVHYYNLALAHVRLGQPKQAISAFDRAVERRPDHPVIRLERAALHRVRGHLDLAQADLDYLRGLPDSTSWVKNRVADEQRRVIALRRVEARQARSR